MMSESITISLLNTNGLNKQSIAPLLQHVNNSSILLLTETWLLPLNKFLTNWKQYHTYAIKTDPRAYVGKMGISLLINPSCPYAVHHLPNTDDHSHHYKISFTIANRLIHCLYLPPSLDDDVALDILSSLQLQHPSTNNTIICGDFNARHAALLGDHHTSYRGRLFHDWIQANNLHLWNNMLTYGQPTFIKPTGTSIIDWFLSTSMLQNTSMEICADLSLDSDHKLIHLRFSTDSPSPTDTPSHQRRHWKLNRLKGDPQLCQRYATRFYEVVHPLYEELNTLLVNTQPNQITNKIEILDDINDKLCSSLYQALDEVVGRRSNMPSHHQTDFWTPEMLQAVDHRESCYRKWRRASGNTKLHWWLEHQRSRAKVKRLVQQRRRSTWQQFCQRMETGDYAKATATMKKIRSGRTLQPSYSYPDGPQASVDSMARHLQQTFSGSLLNPNNRALQQDLEAASSASQATSPFTTGLITMVIAQLPTRKAPGVDHLTSEMIQPLSDQLAPTLLKFFNLCWLWSCTPSTWRTAQVIPIYKKDSPTDAANYRPISLTSVLRKVLEKCLQPTLLASFPPLDIAQGGFRPCRSALDQALCLQQICFLHKQRHCQPPTLAFLDIKAAYDTVDRQVIWNQLAQTASPPLVHLLQNMFNDVRIEVLLNNFRSSSFTTQTGVLQGSILSPFLYSIYINSLPSRLRSVSSMDSPSSITSLLDTVNCLLYADDVALIGSPSHITTLLHHCETHSHELGYRWNPTKCIILSPTPDADYSLYDTPIPTASHFSYLGVPFKPGGIIDAKLLIEHNTTKTLASMNVLTSLGVNSGGFSRLLSSRIFQQFVRPQMEYGLAITIINKSSVKLLEQAQDKCLRRIFGAHKKSSTLVMKKLTRVPSMAERVSILQVKYVQRAIHLPRSTLLSTIRCLMDSPNSGFRTTASTLSKLFNIPLWHQYNDKEPPPPMKTFIQDYLKLNADKRRTESSLLHACRPQHKVDPILWIPMNRTQRSRCIRWRLGWLPGGKPYQCFCTTDLCTRKHVIHCLGMHFRLNIPPGEVDPLSVIFNQLPTRPPSSARIVQRWNLLWPIVRKILLELECLQHPGHVETVAPSDQDLFLNWINSSTVH